MKKRQIRGIFDRPDKTGEYLLEAWADGYVSRFGAEGVPTLRQMAEKGWLEHVSPFCWRLTGSGTHLTWSIIRHFQGSVTMRRKCAHLVERFPFLEPPPNVLKNV